MAELRASGPLDGLALPVAAGRCQLAALSLGPLAVVTAEPPAAVARLGVAQWLVEGSGVVDVSDAYAGLVLEGQDAAEVLARLVPVDPAAGLPARTLLRHVPVVILPRPDGFGLLVSRSYAASAVADLVEAMRAVAARRDA